MNEIKALLGLFIPLPYHDEEKRLRWGTTMSIGGFPLGWIIVVIAAIVQRLLK